MPTFDVDTSALAKRYKEEEGTQFIDQLFDLLEKPKNKAATSFLTFPELLARVTRLRKGPQVSQQARDRILARILEDFHTFFSVNPVSTSILTRLPQGLRSSSNRCQRAADADRRPESLHRECF